MRQDKEFIVYLQTVLYASGKVLSILTVHERRTFIMTHAFCIAGYLNEATTSADAFLLKNN